MRKNLKPQPYTQTTIDEKFGQKFERELGELYGSVGGTKEKEGMIEL